MSDDAVRGRATQTTNSDDRRKLNRAARCEQRLYDQHFTCNGEVTRLEGLLHDRNVGTISEWTARHNRWSDLEARELRHPEATTGKLEAELSADPRKRRRLYKGVYYRMPPALRVLAYFFFRYVVQLGFLDGRVGFYYNFLQALWFRMLVDAKLAEADAAEPDDRVDPLAAGRSVR